MPASPSSSAQAARAALAARLRELMLDAGIDGKDLSARCGWHPSKTSRILSGKSAPSESDLRTWCTACGADGQAADLIASLRAVELMYLEWRRIHRAGMRQVQQESLALHQETSVCRAYVSNVVPGFLQTTAYATALMRSITDFQGTPDDVAEAVAARTERGRLLHDGRHRFVILIEETVLRYRIGDAETTAGQLGHLLAVMPLPTVSLGIIPFTAQRTVWPLEAFYLFDNEQASVETLTAEVTVTQPRELADYHRAFAGLAKMAVHGAAARALITAAIEALG
ncbi:transcriptional regulator [Kitasatospora herbaricolor]|uniref:helix-turn-helix domain-containing protein n=1 Tax=Kitasatospora herbaricolor TaxID=68217 RepID=UPI001748FC34|nr:helix-turn-helix transcriptional regulator [Kitasatospora herbaricolor]MDQ0305828.1 transcriptional regulator with XRE-family HTH domain [Kitasatospora herbaricolor]GGV48031.1 transcriptional regulator [Kitasatospora herbaricolor]